jgi:hypothetical protein
MQKNMPQTTLPLRMLRKDLGVVLVLLLALALALLIRARVDGRSTEFQTDLAPIRLSYPATWSPASSLQDVLLKVENPYTDSTYKTTMTIESRDLDPAALPSLQELVDRRIEQRSELVGYHLLSANPTQVDQAEANAIEYAYIIQPIDEPRRASLPVVVQAREYVIVAGDISYYITLSAPADEFDEVSATFDRIINSVRLRSS